MNSPAVGRRVAGENQVGSSADASGPPPSPPSSIAPGGDGESGVEGNGAAIAPVGKAIGSAAESTIESAVSNETSR